MPANHERRHCNQCSCMRQPQPNESRPALFRMSAIRCRMEALHALSGKRMKKRKGAGWKPLSRNWLNLVWANGTHTCSTLYYIPKWNKIHTYFILIGKNHLISRYCSIIILKFSITSYCKMPWLCYNTNRDSRCLRVGYPETETVTRLAADLWSAAFSFFMSYHEYH